MHVASLVSQGRERQGANSEHVSCMLLLTKSCTEKYPGRAEDDLPRREEVPRRPEVLGRPEVIRYCVLTHCCNFSDGRLCQQCFDILDTVFDGGLPQDS